jgi:hypothetical protein
MVRYKRRLKKIFNLKKCRKIWVILLLSSYVLAYMGGFIHLTIFLYVLKYLWMFSLSFIFSFSFFFFW